MSYLKPLIALAAATAVAAAPQECLGLRPQKKFADLDLKKSDGLWFPVIHSGQVLGCPKFQWTHVGKNLTSMNYRRSESACDAAYAHLEARFSGDEFDQNTQYGKGMFTKNIAVDITYLGSDPKYRDWAVFYQCIWKQHANGTQEHKANVFLGYSRAEIITKTAEDAMMKAIKGSFEALTDGRSALHDKYQAKLKNVTCDLALPHWKTCLELKTTKSLELKNLKGDWYPVVHNPGCPKFAMSRDGNNVTAVLTLNEGGAQLKSTLTAFKRDGNILLKGPGFDRKNVTYTYLGADKNHTKWTAYYRCKEEAERSDLLYDVNHVSDDFVIFSKTPTIDTRDLNEAIQAIRSALKKPKAQLKIEEVEDVISSLHRVPCAYGTEE